MPWYDDLALVEVAGPREQAKKPRLMANTIRMDQLADNLEMRDVCHFEPPNPFALIRRNIRDRK